MGPARRFHYHAPQQAGRCQLCRRSRGEHPAQNGKRRPLPFAFSPMRNWVIISVVALLLSGCKNKQEASGVEEPSPASAEQNARIEAELVPPPGASAKPDAPTPERLNGAVHSQLTAQLRMYIERT